MAGIEDLKLWRTEPFLETFQEFSPDKKDLGWKYPYQGRWFSPVPYYDWLGPDTIMKELDTKLPFNFYDKAGQIETPGEGFIMKGAKNAADLANDRAVLQEWFPYKDAGPFYKSKLTFDMKPEWYKWQKRAKAAGVEPLSARRPTKGQRKAWEDEIIKKEKEAEANN